MEQRNLILRGRNFFRLPFSTNHNGNKAQARILFTISELHVNSVIRSTDTLAFDILRISGFAIFGAVTSMSVDC